MSSKISLKEAEKLYGIEVVNLYKELVKTPGISTYTITEVGEFYWDWKNTTKSLLQKMGRAEEVK